MKPQKKPLFEDEEQEETEEEDTDYKIDLLLSKFNKIEKRLAQIEAQTTAGITYPNSLVVGDITLGSISSDIGQLKLHAKDLLKDKSVTSYLTGESYFKKKLLRGYVGE